MVYTDYKSFMSEIQQTVSNQNHSDETSKQLNESISSLHELCQGIHEHNVEIKAASDWQDRYHTANLMVQNQVRQIEQLDCELEETTDELSTCLEECEEIKEQLAKNENLKRETDALAQQVEQLGQILTEKNKHIGESEKRLELVEEEIRNQTQTIQLREDEIRNNDQEHKRTLEMAQQQVQAIQEQKVEMKRRNDDLQKRLESVIRDIKNYDDNFAKVQQECADAQEDNSRLTDDLRVALAERESLRPGHKEWSCTRVLTVQMRQILKQLAKGGSRAEIDQHIAELLAIHKKYAKKLGGDEETASEADLPSLMRQRQVQMKLPERGGKPNLLISSEQERAIRRHTGAVRGIMKPKTSSISREMTMSAVTDPMEQGNILEPTQPAPRPRLAKWPSKTPPSTYSSYNRIVASTATLGKVEMTPNDERRDAVSRKSTSKPSTNSTHKISMEMSSDDELLKDLKRSFTSEGQIPNASKPEPTLPTDSGQAQPKARRKKSSGLITYGSQHRLRSDNSQSSAASSATIQSTSIKSSPDSSQDMTNIKNEFRQLEIFEDI